MRFLHTMVRVNDLEASLDFYVRKLGLREVRRRDSAQGKFTLVFLAPPGKWPGPPELEPMIELTHNWEREELGSARNFGHLAFEVDDIYATCERLREGGVTILRPPRDGRMAFVRSPDLISVEILQAGEALAPKEPWASMQNTGSW